MKACLTRPACQQAATGETVDGLFHLVLLSPVLTAESLQTKSETVPDALGRISVYPDKGKVSNFCQS